MYEKHGGFCALGLLVMYVHLCCVYFLWQTCFYFITLAFAGFVSHGDVPAVRQSEEFLSRAVAYILAAVLVALEGRTEDGQSSCRIFV